MSQQVLKIEAKLSNVRSNLMANCIVIWTCFGGCLSWFCPPPSIFKLSILLIWGIKQWETRSRTTNNIKLVEPATETKNQDFIMRLSGWFLNTVKFRVILYFGLRYILMYFFKHCESLVLASFQYFLNFIFNVNVEIK